MTAKLADYSAFIKLRLSLLVVFSAAMGFFFGTTGPVDWTRFTFLMISGFLVTGASNGFNQVMEKDLDKLMTRTSDRPLPTERMKLYEGLLLSIVLGATGLLLLALFVNLKSCILGAFALLSYAFAYTPLKRITPFAVFVGAFPGAVPPMLGYTAATGNIDFTAWLLFAIQFIWQFPHFWAIAWVLDDDYKKAGFKMLPSGGRDRASAFQTMVYTLGLIPLGFLPYTFHKITLLTALLILLAGILFSLQALRLYRQGTVKAASQLMLGSFAYLPFVQLLMVFGKI
jgi:heme o synthase